VMCEKPATLKTWMAGTSPAMTTTMHPTPT
jgi:hypothetical protein